MDPIRLIVRAYRRPFAGVMLASLANAALGVGVIAYINQRLIAHQDAALAALPEFFGLILALLVIAFIAQLGLTALGHHFVLDLRSRLVKRILDTDIARQEAIGGAALIASLSADIRNVIIAFVSLPELVQGLVLTLACAVYLGWLSLPLLWVTAVWIAVTLGVGNWLVRRVWANIMMLGAIGLVFFLANAPGWADTTTAATYALTLLFLRTPMIGAVGALPTLLNAQVAFNKLAALDLADYRAEFDSRRPDTNWQRIQVENATFAYDTGFAIGPIDFTLDRGELIFIIGGNGSGKTTFARLLSGLYAPDGGRLAIDGHGVDNDRARLRHLFSSVFTDFHLFDRLLGDDGQGSTTPSSNTGAGACSSTANSRATVPGCSYRRASASAWPC